MTKRDPRDAALCAGLNRIAVIFILKRGCCAECGPASAHRILKHLGIVHFWSLAVKLILHTTKSCHTLHDDGFFYGLLRFLFSRLLVFLFRVLLVFLLLLLFRFCFILVVLLFLFLFAALLVCLAMLRLRAATGMGSDGRLARSCAAIQIRGSLQWTCTRPRLRPG